MGLRLLATMLGGCGPAGEPAGSRPVNVVLVAGLRGELEPCGCSGELVGGLDRVSAAIAAARSHGRGTLLVVAGDILGARVAGAQPHQEAAKAALFDRIVAAWRPALMLPHPPAAENERLSQLARAGGATLVGAGQRDTATSLAQRGGAPSAVLLPAGANAVDACLRARREGVDLVIALTQNSGAPAEGSACQPDLWLHTDHSEGPRQIDGVLHVGLDSPEQRVVTARLVRPAQPLGKRAWSLVPHEGSSWEAPLGASAPRDAAVRAQMDALFASFAGGGSAPPAPASRAPEGPHFVGARTCAACHAEAYVWWRGTPHGRALRTLEMRGRQHDLACVACHVTGFGEPGGAAQPPFGELAAVGCESCHGAGSAHADDPAVAPGAGEGPVPERTCTRCHDAAHSVGFAFAPARAALDARAHRVLR